jgi:signal peptidase
MRLSAVLYGVSLLACATLTFFLSLLAWTLVPLAFGWSSSVVMTGSMAPEIQPGDVVVTAPVKPGTALGGHVVRFRDPADPGRYLMHRIIHVRPDGEFVTKGDANDTADSTPVPRPNVTGEGRLRVPWVGLPALWLHLGAYGKLAVFGAILLGLCALVPPAWRTPLD